MHIASLLLNITSPLQCVLCSKEGAALCEMCLLGPGITTSLSTCYRCNAVVGDYATCSSCRRKTRIVQMWSVFEYSADLKKVVQSYKYNRNRWLAAVLAEQIAAQLPYLPQNLVITHVPAAPSRKRRRGYDQSALLAEELARRINRPHRQLLLRSGNTAQVGATRAKRIQQAQGAYRARSISEAIGSVLVVDDVLTTGATLESCAQALHEAGAETVYGAVVARDM